jgi:chromosome partitioning protein
MHTIAVFNQKGGVGKTTLSVNLALALAGLGYKTVFIDMDFQSDGTRQLWHGAQPELTVYDLLAQRVGAEEAALTTEFPNLSVVASSPRLSLVDAGEDRAGAYQTELRDNSFARAGADFVIVDCPPSLGRLTANALSAANFLLLPVTPSPFAMEGMKRTLGIVESVRAGLNPELRDYRVCLSMMDETPVSRAIAADIVAAHGERVLPTRALFDREVNKAAVYKTPALLFNPDSLFSRSLAGIVVELVEALGLKLAPEALENMRQRIAARHQEITASVGGVAAVNVGGVALPAMAEATAPAPAPEARPRAAGGRLSYFVMGSVVGAAAGFFGRAYL